MQLIKIFDKNFRPFEKKILFLEANRNVIKWSHKKDIVTSKNVITAAYQIMNPENTSQSSNYLNDKNTSPYNYLLLSITITCSLAFTK